MITACLNIDMGWKHGAQDASSLFTEESKDNKSSISVQSKRHILD